MGYAGEESMYVSQAVLHAAYDDTGLALDFYKSGLGNKEVVVLSRLCMDLRWVP